MLNAWLDRPAPTPGLGSLLLNIAVGLFFLGIIAAAIL